MPCHDRSSDGTWSKTRYYSGTELGEYAAISVAGGLEPIDAIRLVRKRGTLMQHTVPAGEGAMCAILGLDAEKIEAVTAEMKVYL